MSDEKFATDVFGNDIYMPERDKVLAHQEALHKVLMAVAPIHCDDKKRYEWWVANVFVTDMSSISDFGPEEEDLARISSELGITVDECMPLYELAALISKPQTERI
jgi:hypothetical protein